MNNDFYKYLGKNSKHVLESLDIPHIFLDNVLEAGELRFYFADDVCWRVTRNDRTVAIKGD